MIKNWLRSHAWFGFFVLAFGISWSGILIIVAATGYRLAAPSLLATGLFFVLMLLGPSVSGLALTALVDRRTGLRDLWARFLCWKVGVGWYAVALLTAPLLLFTILLSLSAFSASAYPLQSLWPLLAVGLVAGSFEEIGWTGFATQHLLARRSIATAGLLLGLIWALWHALVVFLVTFGAMGNAWIWTFAIVYLATLTPYRILMTWVYANTQSVLLAVLMHASYTGWLLVLFPTTSPVQSLIWQSAFAAALWIAAALVLRKSNRRATDGSSVPAIEREVAG